VIKLLSWLFTNGDTPHCLLEADVNGSNGVNLVDLTSLTSYLFAGGAPPAPCP
jgi:hypothetical protein